jgi:O-antigen ligase
MLLFAVGAVAVVSSGSRGALLAAAIGCLTLLITSRVPWRRVILVLLLVGSVTAAAGLLTPFGQRAQEVFRQRVLVLTIAEQHDSGRAGIRARALALGRESPLFGAGLNSFSVRTGFVHPHNVFLEVFAEGGAIGLGLFLFMLAAVIGTFWKRRAALDPSSVAAFALIFVACQFSGDLYDSRGLFLFPMLALTAGTEA